MLTPPTKGRYHRMLWRYALMAMAASIRRKSC